MSEKSKSIKDVLNTVTSVSEKSLLEMWRELDSARTHSNSTSVYQKQVDTPPPKVEPDPKLSFYKNYVRNVLPESLDVETKEDSIIVKFKNK